MNPQIFGWQHLTFLAIFAVITISSLVIIKLYVKNEKLQDIIVRCVGALLFVFILWNRISIAVSKNNGWYLIPDSFCGMSSLVLSLATMFGRRNNNVLHFVFYFALVGGFITIIYPDFIGQNISFWYSNTISGLLHHATSFYMSLLLCLVGWFTPNYKKWPNIVIGFLSYITLGAFLISVLGYDDAFYIMNPILSGTPLTVWLLIPIFIVFYTIFMIVYELIKRKMEKKKLSILVDKEDKQEDKDKNNL